MSGRLSPPGLPITLFPDIDSRPEPVIMTGL